jgi:heptosyltransferase-2
MGHTRCIDLIGKTTLREFMWLCSFCKVFIGCDTGLSHIAAALGVPTVVIFGPTLPEFGFVPLGDVKVVQTDEELECRPCSPHGPKICPEGHHRCMESISAERVKKEVGGYISL